jgi:uncharacterized protein (DUF1501 family)
MSELFSRRAAILAGGMTALGLVAPRWLSAIAQADVLKPGKRNPNTVLVVCQLSGGNDGLNTVVPYADKNYYQLRPTIGIPEDEVHKMDERVGFNPGLSGLANLYKQGKVAVVQNVGYPNPSRSHFKSMEIWQSASPEGAFQNGWIGRHFDVELSHHPLSPVSAVALASERPLLLEAEWARIPCFASLADVQNLVGDLDSEKRLGHIHGTEANPTTLQRTVREANCAAQLQTFVPKQTYNADPFGNGFRQAAQLIVSSPATRLVYFSAGGFDTHARQVEHHQGLLKQFGDAVNSFQNEMEAIGRAENVVVMTFSEFGRRANENASMGTDHGAAAPMFLIGNRVKGGLHGSIPDLGRLVEGDVEHKIDFREVYAEVLDQWLGGDSEVVLGQRFMPVDLFAS